MKITEEEKKALKGRGFLLARDGEHFIARIVTQNGKLSSEQLEALSGAARKFGSGEVAFTIRNSVEIQGIAYENIQPLCDYLAGFNLYSGGTGAKIRPIICCKGTVCPHGIIDTQGFAKELYERYYIGWREIALPHKFKIAVGGCPNNCVKPGLNDFAVVGQRVPKFHPELCRQCAVCNASAKCPMKIWSKDDTGAVRREEESCTNCGKCIDACVFHAVSEEQVGYAVQVGGYWGKRQRIATALDGVYTKEEVLTLLDGSLAIWREKGKTGERFGMFIDRYGVENFKNELMALL